MKQLISKITKGEEGSGLVLALMVLIVLSVLGSALGVVTVGSYRLSNVNQDSNSAYYIAEAGANMVYEEIESRIVEHFKKNTSRDIYFSEIPSLITNSSYTEFSEQLGKQPSAEVEIEGPIGKGAEREYKIISTGKVNNKQRTVGKLFTAKWIENKKTTGLIPLPPKNAVITSNKKLLFNRDNLVKGNIIYDSNLPEGVDHEEGEVLSTDGVNLNLYFEFFKKSIFSDYIDRLVKDSINRINVNSNIKKLDTNISFPRDHTVREDIITSKGNIDIERNGIIYGDIITYNGNINIGRDTKIYGTIFTEKGDISIDRGADISNSVITNKGKIIIGRDSIVDGSVISGNNHIDIGRNSFIKDSIISRNGHITFERDNLVSEPSEVGGSILTGNGHIALDRDFIIRGSIITGNGNISVNRNSLIEGSIITGNGKVTLERDLEILGAIISGNNDITIERDSSIKGAIFAGNGSIDFDRDIKIIYSELYHSNFPFGEGLEESIDDVSIEQLITSVQAIEQ